MAHINGRINAIIPFFRDRLMLSYRHSFHAGNHADVLKHTVLCLILDAMISKDKPFVYMDTHAGAGSYRLNTHRQQKQRSISQESALSGAKTANLSTQLSQSPESIESCRPASPLSGKPQVGSMDTLGRVTGCC